MTEQPTSAPARTPLYDRHVALGGKIVDFAGYLLPVNYSKGVLAEHLWTRSKAGLFDVSHMGQAFLSGADVARRLEALVPADLIGLGAGKIRYTQFTTAEGGTLDDLMATKLADDRLYLVVNAACKARDFSHLRQNLPNLRLDVLGDAALLALQGPLAARALEKILPGVAALPFMSARAFDWRGAKIWASRSGYCGEDGFEISLPAEVAGPFADLLLEDETVAPIGLGARDSLRLEAGLCLYGHELDEQISPVEAALMWSIAPRRRAEGGFLGAERILREIFGGPDRIRVGLALEGKALAREGAKIVDAAGAPLGVVSSGGFAPSLGRPIAMGFVPPAFSAAGTQVFLMVREKPLPARVAALPFVPTRYVRPTKI